MSKKYNLGPICDENAGTYSEEEVQIGTFLGKPLYRRVYSGTTPTSTSGYSIIDISDIDYDYINISDYLVKSKNVYATQCTKLSSTTISFWIRTRDFTGNANQIVMNVYGTNPQDYFGVPYHVIIEYTKLSDN